jgi:hypothetical protein
MQLLATHRTTRDERSTLARLCLRLNFAAVTERLNAEEQPSRTGKPWAPETVRGIIQRA